jgi:hypothetical protein
VLWHEPSESDLLFITLNKSEALFSPSTRYRDLALGPSLFHWESQSTTTAASPTGQRTIHHEARGSRQGPLEVCPSSPGVRRSAPVWCAGLAQFSWPRRSRTQPLQRI